MQRTLIVDDLASLAESWRVHLEAANLSPKTIKFGAPAHKRVNCGYSLPGPAAILQVAPKRGRESAKPDGTDAST